jgi:mRNA interferase MazF
MMDRGEVWWALLDEKRPVVLLSPDGAEELQAIQVVAPAGTDITDVAIEVRLGNGEGLANEGVVRVALPRTGFIPCTSLVTLTRRLDRASRKTVTGKAPRARGCTSARPTRVAPRRRQAQSPSKADPGQVGQLFL